MTCVELHIAISCLYSFISPTQSSALVFLYTVSNCIKSKENLNNLKDLSLYSPSQSIKSISLQNKSFSRAFALAAEANLHNMNIFSHRQWFAIRFAHKNQPRSPNKSTLWILIWFTRNGNKIFSFFSMFLLFLCCFFLLAYNWVSMTREERKLRFLKCFIERKEKVRVAENF